MSISITLVRCSRSLGPTTGELGLLVDNYKISSLIAGWFRRKGTGLD